MKLSREDILDYYGVHISHEYNAMDWPRFFAGPFNMAYRALTSKTKLKIKNPGVLINLFVGKWTTVGNISTVILNSLAGNFGNIVVEAGKQTYDAYKGKKSAVGEADKNTIKNTPNMYKVLFVDYKDAKDIPIERINVDLKLFKAIITELKKTECAPVDDEYEASTSQLGDLKLFRPKEIEKEMSEAISYYKSNVPELENIANNFAQWITNNVVKYILDNCADESGYIKK